MNSNFFLPVDFNPIEINPISYIQNLNNRNFFIESNNKAQPFEETFNSEKNFHTIFDPILIESGNSCSKTGARSIVDVPPVVHYPTIGRFLFFEIKKFYIIILV